MALIVFAVVGGGIAFGLRHQDRTREASDPRPSIAGFSPENLPESMPNNSASEASETETEENTPALEKPDEPSTITIKVLNGGAAGGSAGKMAAYLKKNSYAKAEAGNANGSNSGIVIYYSSEMEDESKVLQLLLLKEYKGVVAKPVEEAKISEAKSAPVVVVLGS